jgi:ring-1,2-phenylacetyl-CoA epoxidase subunit PaaD
MVTRAGSTAGSQRPGGAGRPRAWDLLEQVPDPEIPVVSVVDLGIVRNVAESADGRAVVVTITPTYSGCPATEVIARDVRTALEASYDVVDVQTQLSPAWTTDWMSDAGRQKLGEFGIAPPGRVLLPMIGVGRPEACPRCGSAEVEELAGFGSTPCKALWRCTSCREPFDYFKKH